MLKDNLCEGYVDKGKMLTCSSLGTYNLNKNERNIVASCYKSGII